MKRRYKYRNSDANKKKRRQIVNHCMQIRKDDIKNVM